MAIKETQAHEMAYDTETSQVVFNGRNITGLAPHHRPFPARLVRFYEPSKVEGNTLELAASDKIDGTTLELNSGNIVGHTLEM